MGTTLPSLPRWMGARLGLHRTACRLAEERGYKDKNERTKKKVRKGRDKKNDKDK